jgi:hypothetical protein
MSSTADFLYEAYSDIEAGNLQYASALLESLVSIEPGNIEAWEAYMQLCQTCEELDCICERVLQVPGLSEADIESILDYYYFLRQRMKTCQAETAARKMIKFELVDQFTYTLRESSTINSQLVTDSLSLRSLFAGLLEKSIIFLYVVLLITGIKLLAKNIQYHHQCLEYHIPRFKKGIWQCETETNRQVP